MLQMQCLGDLTVVVDGVSVPALTNSKAAALWLYVALTGGTCSRALLCRVFWGELDDAAARANLRVLLTRLRQELHGHVRADRATVTVPASPPWKLDLAPLDAPPTNARDDMAALLALRIEDFLGGLRLRKAPEFDDWLSEQRETLSRRYLARLTVMADGLREAGQHGDEAEVLRRCLSLAPWSEPHHRALIRAYIDMGQRGSAIAQYEACAKALRRELDVAPDASTHALYESVLHGDPADAVAQGAVNAPPVTASPAKRDAVRRLPFDESLPWVGRGEEQTRLANLLTSADARVVTLVGPGGIGKTHLALAVGVALSDRFPDGACFVDLSDLVPQAAEKSGTLVAHRVAAAMGAVLPVGRERDALAEVLAPRRQLLILDNFEQVADARDLVAALVRRSNGLRILVTSRQQLGMATEWVVRLVGLPFADAEHWTPEARDTPAVRLFCDLAQRQQTDFDVEANGPDILRICRAVDGYPLAIVLAARWLTTLSCRDVADRLCESTEILNEAPVVAENPRHAGMASVFDQSWRLLAADERAVFSALCACRGGFTPESAIAISGGTLATIASLTAKSLLQRVRGRLDVHPLLRDFGESKLRESPMNAAVREAHARHFSALLQTGHRRFRAHADTTILDDLRAEQGNLRTVFDQLIDTRSVEALTGFVSGLWTLYRMQGWFDEAVIFLERALAVPGLAPPTAARWRLWLSDACFQLGRHADCRAAALECVQAHGDITAEDGSPRWHMLRELACTLIGRRWRWADLDQAAVDNIARAHNRLAHVYFYEGDRPRFVASTLRSINIDRAGNLPAHMASGALVLSYTPFKKLAARYAARAARLLDRSGMAERAWAHEQLCLYWLAKGDFDAAATHGRAGADIFAALRQYRSWGECTALVGYAHQFSGRLPEARAAMQVLHDEGMRVREAASELWGLLALRAMDLRIGPDGLDGDLDRDLDTIDKLAAQVVDPNTGLLRHGVLAWRFARAGRSAEAVASVDTFCRVFDRASMTSIYAVNGFIGGAMALMELSHRQSVEPQPLAKLSERLFEHARSFGRVLPGARPQLTHLQGLWWIASGRPARGERLIAKVLRGLPENVDRRGFVAGLQLPR